MKTLLDMQNDFDKAIDEIMKANGKESMAKAITKADALAKVSKQKLNSITIIQKGDKMCGRSDRISAVIGELKNEKGQPNRRATKVVKRTR